MKRGILYISIISFFAVFLFTSLVAGANTCNSPDQIILRLSSDTNAHAEVWNGVGSYTTAICYDEIFLQPGNGDHTCAPGGSNRVLRLSSDTNAHAESPLGTIYNTEVCYDGLTCRLDTDGVCDSTEKAVVRLSSQINAHLEIASGTNYNNVICCSESGGVPPSTQGNAYWADTSSQAYSAGATIILGATLQLVAEGVPDSAQVTFTVFDRDSVGADDQITQVQVNAIGTVARYNWAPSPSDYNQGNDIGDGDPLEIYFTAQAQSYDEISNEIFLSENIIIGEPEKKGCAQFTDTDQSTCNNAQDSIWEEDEASIVQLTGNPVDGAGGAGCGGTRNDGSTVECSCNWNSTNSQCNFRFVVIRTIPPLPGGNSCIGGCNINTQYGECTDNSAAITYLTSFGPVQGTDCSSGTYLNPTDEQQCRDLSGESENIDCGLSPSLILPFFSLINLISVVFLIGMIYIFLSVNAPRYIFKHNSAM